MSTFEKIASVIIAILLIGTLVFSYHELTERPEHEGPPPPDFAHSVGSSLEIGPFGTLLSEQSSGGMEDNCQALQPVILGTLHDVDEHLEELGVYQSGTFEVNQQTLDLLCNKNASVTLSDVQGDKLILEKIPFVREVPPGGAPNDIGTDVRINATVILPGAVPPSSPTTYGEELIPDQYLGTLLGDND